MATKFEYKEGEQLTIHVGEHIFVTPAMPPRDQFLFHDLKPEDQYWKRQTDFPKEFYDWHDDPTDVGYGVELDAKKNEYVNGRLVALDKETSSLLFDKKKETGREGLQEREYRRMTEGVWMFNNGEPTFLTGDHYGVLQWGAMLGCDNSVEPGSNYGQYYQFQRDMCYYFIICEIIEFARGGGLVKPKKTGLTQLMALICLIRGMTKKQKNIRMMSITEDDAKKTLFKLIRHAVDKMPAILLPSRSKQNEGEIIFGPPDASKNPLRKKKNATLAEYLDSLLCTVATRHNAFDSITNYIALIDEFPKIEGNAWPDDILEATLPTVIEGFKRKGTIFWLSYVPEKTGKSFYQCRQIFKDSKLRTRKTELATGEPYGDTKSKLICHTLLASEGMFNCCDIYGKAILKLVVNAIQKEIDGCNGDLMKIQAVKRQYPMNEADPWKETGREETPFDNLRLSTRAEVLEDAHAISDFPYQEYNLSFEKEPQKERHSDRYKFEGEIRLSWVTDDMKMAGAEPGKFKWFRPEWTPKWFLDKHINKVKTDPKTGMLMPNRDSPFFISFDPTKYRISKNTGKGSKNAIQVFIMPNAEVNAEIGKNVTNRRLMCSYLFRHNNPAATMKDIMAMILYFGCMVQIESNVETWATKLIEYGLGNFVMMVNEDGALEPWNPARKQYLFTSNKPQIDQYFDSGAEFLGEPMGPGDIDNIDYIDDLDVLLQLMQIRKDNTTEYDAAVAFLQGQMGMDAWLGWKRSQDKIQSGPGQYYADFVLGALR